MKMFFRRPACRPEAATTLGS